MKRPIDVWVDRLLDGGSFTVFSGGCEGVPTLTDMSELAKEFKAEVVHLGYGCFSAKVWEPDSTGVMTYVEVFDFMGGGAMTRVGPNDERSFFWSNFGFPARRRSIVRRWLRVKYPGLPVTREEARRFGKGLPQHQREPFNAPLYDIPKMHVVDDRCGSCAGVGCTACCKSGKEQS